MDPSGKEVNEIIEDTPVTKEARYYWKHREELKEKRLAKLLENPEYREKYQARLKRKAELEEERKGKEEKRKEREKRKSELEEEKRLKEERKDKRLAKAAKILETPWC
jgi:hypothetical protein